MFVELLEQLRCPKAHQATPLIASAARTDARHIVNGLLGCPLCRAEFPIVNGVAWFTAATPPPAKPETPSAEEAMRIAAFLELTDTRGFALIGGRWAAHIDHIGRLSDTPLVVVNPSAEVHGDVAAVLIVAEAIPLATASARAAALDDALGVQLAVSMVEAVRLKGRVMGPASMALPPGLAELTRDERNWVAEKSVAPDTAPRLTPLSRAKR